MAFTTLLKWSILLFFAWVLINAFILHPYKRRKAEAQYESYLGKIRSSALRYNQENLSRQFSYTSLPRSRHGKPIRLLELLPGLPSDPVVFNLREADLHDGFCPEYEAVSYCWGSGVNISKITDVHGRHMIVGFNLHQALEHFRLGDRTRLLWVDAICINQTDLDEKATQVRMMDEIYKSAERVLVWLSREGDRPHENNEMVVQMVKTLLAAKDRTERAQDRRTYANMSTQDLLQYGIPSVVSHWEEYNAFFGIFLLPWFRRVWIIQEVTLAKQVQFHCGKMICSWDELFKVWSFFGAELQMLQHFKHFRNIGELETLDFLNINKTKEEVAFGLGAPVLEIFDRHRTSRATDPRDKVFALMHLAIDNSIDVPVDYQMSCSEIYHATAKAIVLVSSDLNILSYSGTGALAKDTELPHWVPDWRVPIDYYPLVNRSGLVLSKHNATRGSPAYRTIDSDGRSLLLRGLAIGRIVRTSQPMEPYRAGTSWWQDMRKNAMRPLHLGQWRVLSKTSYPTTTYATTSEPAYAAFIGALAQGWDHFRPAIEEELQSMLLFRLAAEEIYNVPKGMLLDYIRALLLQLLLVASCVLVLIGFKAEYSTIMWGANGRQFVVLDGGLFSLAPGDAQVGDAVWLLQGGKVPVVLREAENGAGMVLVGECYVHGAMKGEFWQPEKCEEVRLL